MNLAARLAGERGARIAAVHAIVVPLELPLDAELPEDDANADEILDHARAIGDAYGIDVVTRVTRARAAGRAIVDEAAARQSEIVVIGAPRRRRRAVFGGTVDFVLRNAPCRVMVAASQAAA
jgi:APA family basic amino acid/polyamine antiporter